eukprot:756439_1
MIQDSLSSLASNGILLPVHSAPNIVLSPITTNNSRKRKLSEISDSCNNISFSVNKKQKIEEEIKENESPHYSKWAPNVVGEWLQTIAPSVPGLKQNCIEQEISGEFVHKLNENSLFALGIKSFPSRISIINAIQSLQSPMTPTTPKKKSMISITSASTKSWIPNTPSSTKTKIKISKRKKRHTTKIKKWYEQSQTYKKCQKYKGQLSLMWHKGDSTFDWKKLRKGDLGWDKLSVFEAASLIMVIREQPTSLKELHTFYEDWFGVDKSFGALCPKRSGYMMHGGFERSGYYWIQGGDENNINKAEACVEGWTLIIDNNEFLKKLRNTKGPNATDEQD